MQNKFGFHMCKDYSGQHPEHVQLYIETTVEKISEWSTMRLKNAQKATIFDLETETVIENPV